MYTTSWFLAVGGLDCGFSAFFFYALGLMNMGFDEASTVCYNYLVTVQGIDGSY